MYQVSKRMEISGSHQLELPYSSPCSNLHGHNWIITVYCKAKKLNESGMVVDFAVVKKAIHGELDHSDLNDLFPFNPTAENIAKWICEEVSTLCHQAGSDGYCYKVEVQESEGNIASYIEENE